MLVGEAPGRQEAECGRPFVGRAGRILNGLLESIGIDREGVYLTNVVKDRPPGNRKPHREEIQVYAEFLLREIEIVEPQVIASLGRLATEFILEQFELPRQGLKIGDLHGEMLEADGPHGEVVVVPLYHPAAELYNQDLADIMAGDFEVLRRFV